MVVNSFQKQTHNTTFAIRNVTIRCRGKRIITLQPSPSDRYVIIVTTYRTVYGCLIVPSVTTSEKKERKEGGREEQKWI